MRIVIWLSALFFALLIAGCTDHGIETQEASEKAHRQWAESQIELKQKILDEEVKYVRIRFGEVDAQMYHLCKTHPPTERKNQDKCTRLDAKVKKALAADQKW